MRKLLLQLLLLHSLNLILLIDSNLDVAYLILVLRNEIAINDASILVQKKSLTWITVIQIEVLW
jgi:hypothetical protein